MVPKPERSPQFLGIGASRGGEGWISDYLGNIYTKNFSINYQGKARGLWV